MKARLIGLFAVGVAGFALLLTGCPFPVTSSNGSLTVTFADTINAKVLSPSISMDAASYTVSGVGPGEASFSVSTTGGTVTVASLRFGSWTITVNAFNPGGTLIGQGDGTVAVHTGQVSTVSITVVPLAGDGTLDLSVSWPAADVESPTISASLLSTTGSTRPLAFSVAAGTATFSSSSVPAGYHTLVVQLLDNGTLVMGAVEVVRIAAGARTTGSYTFSKVNKPGGTIVVNITPALGNPIPVSIGGSTSKLTAGTTATVTASAGDATPGVVWVWYLNGQAIGTGASLTFGSTLAAGYYRLDLTGFTADGTRAGSASVEFTVVTAAVVIQPASVSVIYGAGDGIWQRYPGLVVDSAGTVTVAFHQYDSTSHAMIITSADGYSTPVDLGPDTDGFGEGPMPSLDETTGLLHALIPGMAYGYDFFHADASDWSRRTRITSLDAIPGRHEMFGQVAAGQGIVHALWRMYNQEDGQVRGYRIQYATSQDWSAWEYVRQPIFGTLTDWGPSVSAPAMSLDELGVTHALWSDSAEGGALMYARSSDYTVSPDPDPLAAPGSMRRVWTARPLPLTFSGYWPNYDIAAGGGVVYVVQAEGDISVYASADGGASWQVAAQIHDDGVPFQYVRAVYRDGALRIGAQGYDGSANCLAYISSRDWAARNISFKAAFTPLISEGFNRTFDYRNGKAYFVWNTATADNATAIVLAVAPVGP